MRRNLWLLDLTLLIAVVVTGMILRQRWTEMSLREEKLLKQVVAPAPPAPLPTIPSVSPVAAANYMEAVQMMLFARDRNPNVILDPPPPPPPPPQMPALPVSFGVIDLGDGPRAILAEKPGAAHRSYRPGDKIGEFKVVAMNSREILFDWNGEPVKRSLEELAATKSTIPPESRPDTAPVAPPPQQQASSTTNLSGEAKGPGTDLGNETRACTAGDTTPAGTVQDGLRKVVNKTPFGEVCRWEPAK